MDIQTWELLSYVVTVVGLPMAVIVFSLEQRKQRLNEQDAVYESISEQYQDFLHEVLGHPDLHLFSMTKTPELDENQHERMLVLFSMLIALFERAYVLMYEKGLKGAKLRRWRSWEDYMHEWCAREDFRDLLDVLLLGEDPEFCDYIRGLASGYANPEVKS
jgi:hypothetical protein